MANEAKSETTPARALFQVASEQGWAAFEAACRKILADEWRLGFEAGGRLASRLGAAFAEEAEHGK